MLSTIQIISNLVTNSSTIFKNHKVEKPTIKIEIGRKDDKFYIKYSDNGPGLCEAFKREPQKILKQGVTDRRNANGEVVGTGMGLVSKSKGKQRISISSFSIYT